MERLERKTRWSETDEPVLRLETMSAEQLLTLNAAIVATKTDQLYEEDIELWRDFEDIDQSLSCELVTLPGRDLEKSKELMRALTDSANVADRLLATDAISALAKEHWRDEDHTGIWLWLRLIADPEVDVYDAARTNLYSAIAEGELDQRNAAFVAATLADCIQGLHEKLREHEQPSS